MYAQWDTHMIFHCWGTKPEESSGNFPFPVFERIKAGPPLEAILVIFDRSFLLLKVARNEVENASFAQRSAHRDSRIWRPELIEPAAERKRRARADDDRRSNRPSPTHRFCHSAIFRPITPYNVWFFWVSRHRSIILAKKMETFSGRFWEIPGNVLKLELLKMLIDHKNTSVFFQAVSGMSS